MSLGRRRLEGQDEEGQELEGHVEHRRHGEGDLLGTAGAIAPRAGRIGVDRVGPDGGRLRLGPGQEQPHPQTGPRAHRVRLLQDHQAEVGEALVPGPRPGCGGPRRTRRPDRPGGSRPSAGSRRRHRVRPGSRAPSVATWPAGPTTHWRRPPPATGRRRAAAPGRRA